MRTMVRMWSLAIVLASAQPQKDKKAEATTTKSPKTTTQATTTQAPRAKAAPEAPKTTATKASPADSSGPLFPTVDLLKSTASLSYALISDIITLDSSSVRGQLAPVVEVLHKVPQLTGEVYRQTVDKVSSHAPAARDFIYEQAAAAEVHVITAKSVGKNLYKEHLSEHLDPHVSSAQLFYETQVSPHVDTALASYADAHPVILNHSGKALTVAQEIFDSATTNVKQQFDMYYPAACTGVSNIYEKVQYSAGYALHPIELPIGKETLRFPNGIADMILAGVWIVFLLYIALFVFRYSFCVVKCALKTVKFLLVSVIFFTLKTVFKVATGLISFLWRTVFWFLGLFCFCWCCGTCGKRKVAAKKGDKGSAAAGDKASVKGSPTPAKTKPEPTKQAPAQKQDGKKKKK